MKVGITEIALYCKKIMVLDALNIVNILMTLKTITLNLFTPPLKSINTLFFTMLTFTTQAAANVHGTYVLFANLLCVSDYFPIESLEIEQNKSKNSSAERECTILK